MLKRVCHASLNFIDPFDNPIIKLRYVLCLTRVNLFDTCDDEMRFCLLIFRSDNPLLKTDYHNQKNTLSEKKKASRFLISPVKWTSKPESRQCNEKAGNLRPKSGDLAGLHFGTPTSPTDYVVIKTLNWLFGSLDDDRARQ